MQPKQTSNLSFWDFWLTTIANMATFRELEIEDFQLALKLLHSSAPNAKEEMLKLVDKYSTPIAKPQALSGDSSPVKAPNPGKRTANISDSETDVEDDDNSPTPEPAGSGCYLCKKIGINFDNSSMDDLMKCHSCSVSCHRECHKPAISKAEFTDPRFIWYCIKCNKIVKNKATAAGNKPAMKAASTKGSLASGSSLSSLSAAAAAAAAKRKADPLRKPGSNFGSSAASSVPIAKANPTNLSMNSVQQRIANRKVKK